MRRYKRSQLNAISASYPAKANKEAHQRINEGGISDDDIMMLKKSKRLKKQILTLCLKNHLSEGGYLK